MRLLSHIRSESVQTAKVSLAYLESGDYLIDSTSPLLAAVERDSPEMCAMLISSSKCHADVRHGDTEYPLIHGLQRYKFRAVHSLLNGGANPRCRDLAGCPACFYCCKSPVQLPTFQIVHDICRDALFDLADDRTSCLHIAASYMQHNLLYRLHTLRSSENKYLPDIPTTDGVNALMISACVGDDVGFTMLLQCIPFYRETYTGRCSLCYMVTENHPDMLKRVLDMPSVARDSNLNHCLGNCISHCIFDNKLDVCAMLMGRIGDISTWRSYVSGSNMMHIMAHSGTLAMMNLIGNHLKHDNILQGKDVFGNTPLMVALIRSNYAMIDVLYECSPKDMSTRNINGKTLGDLLDTRTA